jgi:Uma2 family endonuclease
MTQAKVKFTNFAAYLSWSNDPENGLEGEFELVDGELVEMPPESELNNWIARCLIRMIANSTRSPLGCTLLTPETGLYNPAAAIARCINSVKSSRVAHSVR